MVSASTPPPALNELQAIHGVEVISTPSLRDARDPTRLTGIDAVVICDSRYDGSGTQLGGELQLLADALLSHRLMGIVLSSDTPAAAASDDDALIWARPDVSGDELWGRVATIRKFRPRLRRMENEIAIMQRLGKKLNQQFTEVDQELRLASRLQRNFLPHDMPQLDDVRFAALYRPATWVSGDDYDVRRLDETHLSFFLADAVGHGVAAGLLTMFIRQAISGKRVTSNDYAIIPPSEVLQALNQELAAQDLPNCQFVTACYGTIDTQTHQLTFSRGGHPHPIHISADGTCREVRTMGGLLGVFPDEEFPATTLSMDPGDKLLIYSDGLEDRIVCRRQRDTDHVSFTDDFLSYARLPAQDCLDALADAVDRSEGSLEPLDDQTCLIVERQR